MAKKRMSAKQDAAKDRKAGVKEDSKQDQKLDKLRGVKESDDYRGKKKGKKV